MKSVVYKRLVLFFRRNVLLAGIMRKRKTMLSMTGAFQSCGVQLKEPGAPEALSM